MAVLLMNHTTEEERIEPEVVEFPEERVLSRDEHSISRSNIPENVLKVLYRLHRSGRKGYLCGGSVRDLLLGRRPKDFDVVTDARPQEIRRLFRNSRIIGRRFRLAHIMFQDLVVEVSTFRREPELQNSESEGDLLVRDDNVFGTPIQDARRRDFTVNGLFYDIGTFSVIDYVGGIDDLRAGVIRVIGDPDIRFREDPVRMMRALEFAARLDFEVEPGTWDAISRHREDILKASPARVTDEILELLRRGWALESMHLMDETGLLEPLVPELSEMIDSGEGDYLWRMLEVLDRTIKSSREINDIVLLSVLLLPLIMEAIERREKAQGERLQSGEIVPFIREQVDAVFERLVMPAWMRHEIVQNFELLWRMQEPPSERKRDWRLVLRERFQDALALYELYSFSSGKFVDSFREWRDLAARVRGNQEKPKKAKRRRRRRPKE
jgi:poly(A) polymerase